MISIFWEKITDLPILWPEPGRPPGGIFSMSPKPGGRIITLLSGQTCPLLTYKNHQNYIMTLTLAMQGAGGSRKDTVGQILSEICFA